MYQKEEIERLAKKYVETQEEEVFEVLIKALESLINVQLGKNYSSLKEFWDDLRQEVLVKLYKNREGIFTTESTHFCSYFYGRIRVWLFRACKQLAKQYDALNRDVIYFEDLAPDERRKIGIEVPPKKPSYQRHKRRLYGSGKRKSITKPNRGLH